MIGERSDNKASSVSAFIILVAAGISIAAGPCPAASSLREVMTQNGYKVIELKVDPEPARQLHVQGRLNGKRVRINIDTDCTVTRVDKSMLRGLKPRDPPEPGDPHFAESSGSPIPVVTIDKLDLGPVTIAAVRAYMTRMHGIVTSWNDADVSLGMDVLEANHAFLDVADAKLYIRLGPSTDGFEARLKKMLLASGWIEAPIASPDVNPLLTVMAQINGHPAQLRLSTKSGNTTLDLRQIEALDLKIREIAGSAEKSNTRRAINDASLGISTLNSFRVGESAELRRVEACVLDYKKLSPDPFDIPRKDQGDLGMEFLQRWGALIDFAAPAVYLSK